MRRIRNHPFAAGVILLFTAIVGMSQFNDAVGKLCATAGLCATPTSRIYTKLSYDLQRLDEQLSAAIIADTGPPLGYALGVAREHADRICAYTSQLGELDDRIGFTAGRYSCGFVRTVRTYESLSAANPRLSPVSGQLFA